MFVVTLHMVKTCIVCGKDYNRRGRNATNSKFCSYKCKNEYQHTHIIRELSPNWKGGVREKICECCGVTFKWEDNTKKPYSSFLKQKTCSQKCKSEMQKLKVGPLSNSWKGGTSKRDMSKQKEWSTKVFIRDNYTCQDCGKRGGYLQAHHIKGYTEYPELRWDIDNGQTLCKKCHYKTYKFYRNQFTETCKK